MPKSTPKKSTNEKPAAKPKAAKPVDASKAAKPAVKKEAKPKTAGAKPRAPKKITGKETPETAAPEISTPAPMAAAPAPVQPPPAAPKMTPPPVVAAKPNLAPAPAPARPQAPAPVAAKPAPAPVARKKIKLSAQTTVKDLAQAMGVGIPDIIKKLMGLGVWATINQKLDLEVAKLVASDAGYDVETGGGYEEEDITYALPKVEPGTATPRAPIVTVMGHVDHGKSSLLDSIRGTNVVASESGGITQHIGAYKVKTSKGEVVFLDTPGHEAFTAMRARGAQVTDIVVLVVAADDGVMPQTVEAIDHAKAGGVPIIVAINKMDKPDANPTRVKQELANHGLQAEDWGGKTIMVEVSAKKKINIDKLLDMLSLEAELLELKATPAKSATAWILEARKDPKMGNVASVLVTDGSLKVGDAYVCGLHWGRVRALIGEKGERMQSAGPSTPVALLGLSDIPQAGDKLIVVQNEKFAKEISAKRRMEFEAVHGKGEGKHLTLEDLHEKIESGAVKELKLVLRADVQGSLEAIIGELSRLRHEEVVIKVLHSGPGDVSLSDVLLAAASDAIILAFHVGIDPRGAEEAKKQNVQISQYSVIYELVGEIKAALEGLLAPVMRDTVTGSAEVRNVFNVTGSGVIAGCLVTQGKINRDSLARIWRGALKVHEGKVTGLKRFKDDVAEVSNGYECGISLSGFKDIRKGDRIECYVQVKEYKKLTVNA